MASAKPPQYIPLRNSERPGDIAELLTPAELEARQQSAPPVEPAAFNFGPALPAATRPAAQAPRAKRSSSNTLIGVGGLLLAVLLIGLSVLSQPGEQPTGASSPAATAARTTAADATMAATTVPTTRATTTAELGIAATTTRAAVVYWAPGGDAQDEPLVAGVKVRVLAYHSGAPDWHLIAGPGIVQPAWVLLTALSTTATAGLPDLAPPPTPMPAPALPAAPPQRAVVPEHCAEARLGGASATACGPEDDATLQARAQADLAEQLGLRVLPILIMTPYPTFPPR
jgi:hypothetical protein